MKVGELYIADCEFRNRPGSKQRPVVILRELEDGVMVIESRSKSTPNLELVLTVDFETNPNYSNVKLSGVSHFYAENFVVIPRESIQPRRLGALREADLRTLGKRLGVPLLD